MHVGHELQVANNWNCKRSLVKEVKDDWIVEEEIRNFWDAAHYTHQSVRGCDIWHCD